MANENMTMSAAGMTALRQREGAVLRYYNDSANNCTYGVGTLAHTGACTRAELQRPVTVAQVNTQLYMRVSSAEAAVKRQVHAHPLTQAQFDSLVSFVYNTGATGSRTTLRAANSGATREVASHMHQNVYVHPHDAHGRRGRAVRVPGLVHRRNEEAAAFQ